VNLRLDVYLHLDGHAADGRLEQILTIVKQLQVNTGAIMADLDAVLVLVSAEDTKLDSVIALIDGLKQQVADALSGTTLPPAVQAKVDAIFSKATSNAAKISDALDENVPNP
jgi:hypothetical protein